MTDGLTTRPLLDDPLVVVTAPDESVRRLEDLAGARWVTGCERCRSELLALCADAGFEPRIAFASDDYVAVQALVATGFGVTVLPRLALEAHRHPGVRTHELDVVRHIGVTTYGRPPHPASVTAVLDAVEIVTTPMRR